MKKALALMMLFALAEKGSAQMAPSGNLQGTVADVAGDPLPGVSVTLLGPGPDRFAQTDAEGRFRFLALDPGAYVVEAKLEGLGAVKESVPVTTGKFATVALVLKGTVAEELVVTARASLIDTSGITPGVVLTGEDLDQIPTAEDPWALLRQAPAVLLDRVDVAGNESASASSFRGAVAGTDQNDIQIDGISISEAPGSLYRSLYFDLDSYAEVQYTTGGSDVTQRTPGVAINLTLKRGENRTRGSARASLVDQDGYLGALAQSEPSIDPSELGVGQDPIPGTRIDRIVDAGLEGGGALVRNRAWLWGSWSTNGVENFEYNGVPTEVNIDTWSLRANYQVSPKHALQVSYIASLRKQFGRGATDPAVGPGSLQDMRRQNDLYRLRSTHVFSSNFFLDFSYGRSDSHRTFDARGDDDAEIVIGADGVWSNSDSGDFTDDTETFRFDGSLFRSSGRIDHEIVFGGNHRELTGRGFTRWPGRSLVHWPSLGGLILRRTVDSGEGIETSGLWAQDTLRLDRVTINAGLRWDHQDLGSLESFAEENPAFPGLLPAIHFGGGNNVIWRSLSPRLGVTWELGSERRTALRASLSRFPQQLATWITERTNPVGGVFVVVGYDSGPGRDELYTDQPAVFLFGFNYDPTDPTVVLQTPNINDPDLAPSLTDELILGADHMIGRSVALGLSLTLRRVHDVLEERRLVRLEDGSLRPLLGEEWVPIGEVAGTVPGTDFSYRETVYVPPFEITTGPDRTIANLTGGTLLTNGSRRAEYGGLTLSATKRYWNHWTLRGYLSWTRGEWNVPEEFLRFSSPSPSPEGGNRDGDLFFVNEEAFTEDLGLDQYVHRGVRSLQSSWRANVSGLVEIAPDRPWGFNLSGNVMARQGYPLPLSDRVLTGTGSQFPVAVTKKLDQFRLSDIVMVDLRLEKAFRARQELEISVYVDGFNLLNDNSAQSRNTDLSSATALWATQTISPRVYRLGTRLRWR